MSDRIIYTITAFASVRDNNNTASNQAIDVTQVNNQISYNNNFVNSNELRRSINSIFTNLAPLANVGINLPIGYNEDHKWVIYKSSSTDGIQVISPRMDVSNNNANANKPYKHLQHIQLVYDVKPFSEHSKLNAIKTFFYFLNNCSNISRIIDNTTTAEIQADGTCNFKFNTDQLLNKLHGVGDSTIVQSFNNNIKSKFNDLLNQIKPVVNANPDTVRTFGLLLGSIISSIRDPISAINDIQNNIESYINKADFVVIGDITNPHFSNLIFLPAAPHTIMKKALTSLERLIRWTFKTAISSGIAAAKNNPIIATGIGLGGAAYGFKKWAEINGPWKQAVNYANNPQIADSIKQSLTNAPSSTNIVTDSPQIRQISRETAEALNGVNYDTYRSWTQEFLAQHPNLRTIIQPILDYPQTSMIVGTVLGSLGIWWAAKKFRDFIKNKKAQSQGTNTISQPQFQVQQQNISTEQPIINDTESVENNV